MRPARAFYRVRQFFYFLGRKPAPDQYSLARSVLGPEPFALFSRLQPAEQAHSIEVLQKLIEQGESNPHLWTAALLHDVGKVHFPLRFWDRVWIVLVKHFLPHLAARWGAEWDPNRKANGWKRMFAVALRHPEWGSEMAARVGVSPMAQNLIRRHQDPLPPECATLEHRLLQKLQAVDDES